MLAGSQFRLRQGFRLRRKRLYGAPAPPRLAGPHGDVPVRVSLHFSCLGELALLHRLPCVKGAVSRKADWDCSSKQHSSGFPARWGRYPLGVSFERAKETKTRLGRSPLRTPLGYEAGTASILWSALAPVGSHRWPGKSMGSTPFSVSVCLCFQGLTLVCGVPAAKGLVPGNFQPKASLREGACCRNQRA